MCNHDFKDVRKEGRGGNTQKLCVEKMFVALLDYFTRNVSRTTTFYAYCQCIWLETLPYNKMISNNELSNTGNRGNVGSAVK